MRVRPLSLALSVVCVAVAGAQESPAPATLSQEQARALKKIARKIDQIERAVKSLETSRTRGTPAFPDAVKRKGSQQERRFRDARQALAALPASEEVRAARAHLADLAARLVSLAGEASGQTQDAAGKAGAWQAHNNSAAHQADRAFVHGTRSYQPHRFELGDRSFRALFGASAQETLELVDALPEVEARIELLAQRYASFGRYGSSMLSSLNEAKGRLRACAKAMAQASRSGARHVQALGVSLDAETAKVLALRDQARAAKRPFPLGYSLMDPSSKTRQLEAQILRSSRYLIRLEPASRARVEAVSAKSLAGYRAVVANASAEILAGQRSPQDDYKGSDKAKLKAFVERAAAGRVHGAKVVSVHLSGEWQEAKAQVWDRSAKAWVAVHKSSLSGVLLVDQDTKHVLRRRIEVERDHLRGDALQLFGDFQRYPQPRPDQLIPRANLTK